MTGKFDSLAYFISVVNINVPDVRGASVVSRLANVAPERIHAYAFLAVSYVVPNADFKMENALKLTKSLVGYELFGYWMYFSQDEADQEIENNVRRLCLHTDFSMLTLVVGHLLRTHLPSRSCPVANSCRTS